MLYMSRYFLLKCKEHCAGKSFAQSKILIYQNNNKNNKIFYFQVGEKETI